MESNLKKVMHRKKCILTILFLIGTSIGLLNYNTPVSSHWDLAPIYVGSKLSVEEAFNTLYYQPGDLYFFRPLAFLLFGSLYNSFGLNIAIFHLLKALSLGLFGTFTYLLLFKITDNRTMSFIASIFSMFAPSVLNSVYKVPEIEVIGTFLAYAAFFMFIKLKDAAPVKTSIIYSITFLFFASASILFKETIRLFLPLMLILYVLFLQKKQFNGYQLISFSVLLIFVIFTSVLSLSENQTSLTDKLPLTFYHFWFIVSLASIQLFYPVFISGVFVLSLSSFISLKKRYEWIFCLMIIIFLTFILTAPAINTFSYMGMILLSSESYLVSFFAILMIVALAVKFIKGDKITKFFSASILLVFFLTIAYVLFVPSSRQYISIRAYIIIFPFLIYLVICSFFDIWNKFKKIKPRTNKMIIMLLLLSMIMMFAYYFFVSPVNEAQRHAALSTTDYNTKSYLSKFNLTDRVVFYTNEIYFTDEIDLEMLSGYKNNTKNTKFFFLNSHKSSNNMKDIEKEMCIKAAGQTPYNEVYIYSISDKPDVNLYVQHFLRGSFKWVESETFNYLKPLPDTSQYFLWPWEYGVIESYQKTVYSPKTLLETYLEDNAVLLYRYNYSYFQLSPWLEDGLYKFLNKIPNIINYNSIGKIYYLNINKLNCSNWYPWETTPDNIKYRFMSQDAIVNLYNNESAPEKVKMMVKGWSFYKPRTLEIYSGDSLLAEHVFSELMVPTEFITASTKLMPGENLLKFHSKEGCDISGNVLKEYKEDKRCISFGFFNVTTIRLKDLADTILYENNWHKQNDENNISFHWMSQNATLFFFNPNNYTERIRLDFIADAFYKPRTLQIYLNDNMMAQHNISDGVRITTPVIDLKPGENTILFHSKEGCDIPSSVGAFNYTSCISMAIGNMEKISVENEITYDEKSSYKVMINDTVYLAFSSNLTAFAFNSKDTEQNITRNFSVWSFNNARNITVYLNGNVIGRYETPSLSDVWISGNIFLPLNLMPGNNTLMFVSGSECMPYYNPGVNFSECLSFAIKEIKPVEEKKVISLSYEDNWHLLERLENLSWRWMSQNASLLVFNPDDSKNTTLNFSVQSFHKNRTLDIYLDGKLIVSYVTPPDRKENIQINRQLNLGKNIITFNSREGCETPKSLGISSDGRCLSFAFANVTIN